MIELKNVSKYYNNNGVVTIGLRNINITLDRNEIVAIVGESGSGKSTLLNVICGVDSYEDGEIYVNGKETSYFNQDDMDAYRKQYVSFIYQSYNIIDSYSVLENVMVPLLLQGKSNDEAQIIAKELINKVGLAHRIKNKGTQLSGGEKQRCVIARALASEAPILACDEPTGNLDSKTGEEIIELIKEVSKDKLVLIVTHNYEQVEHMVTRTIRVHDGEIVEDSKPNKKSEATQVPLKIEDMQVNKKSILNLSLRNIKNTPRKNIFSVIVLTFLAAITLFLYLSSAAQSADLANTGSQNYVLTTSNRLIVYDKDHKAIDTSKLDGIAGDKYANAFYEDSIQYMEIGNLQFRVTHSNHLPNGYTNVKGNTPVSDTDVYLVFPSEKMANSYCNPNTIGQTFKTFDDYKSTYYEYNKLGLKVSGYGYCKELTLPLAVTTNKASNIMNSEVLSENAQNSSYSIVINGTPVDGYINFYEDGEHIYPTDRVTILYSGNKTNFSNSSFNIDYGGIYKCSYTNINWINSSNSFIKDEESFSIILPSTNLSLDNTYELTIYADDVNAAMKQITDAGYSYIIPMKDAEVNKLSTNYILTMFFIGFSVVAGIVLTFVSYVILSRVYVSRNKDFTILRSLGLRKSNMAIIVQVEMAILGFISSLVAMGAIYIVSIFNTDVAQLVNFNTVGITILYLLLMQVFSNIIARRFNKRLFKFTISTSIKGEVARND